VVFVDETADVVRIGQAVADATRKVAAALR
jgi:hypothetical protein